MHQQTHLRLPAVLALATALCCAAPPRFAAQAQALVYDTDFALASVPGIPFAPADGTVTFPFRFWLRNDTGAAAHNVTLELASPLVREPPTGAVTVDTIASGATVAAAGSFTLLDPGVDDADFLLSVLWRVTYEGSKGYRKCYIKAAP